MIQTNIAPEKHIFVCVNERQEGDCCSKVNGQEIFLRIKKEILSRGLGHIWVTKTKCLGFCNPTGATVAIYPKQKLLTEVKLEDVPKIMNIVLED